MKKIGRNFVGASDILRKLYKDSIVGRYFNLIESSISADEIERSLVKNNLTAPPSTTLRGEKIFELVPFIDFNTSNLRFIKAVDDLSWTLEIIELGIIPMVTAQHDKALVV